MKQQMNWSQKRKIIPYDPKLKEITKKQRNTSTLSEILLWKQLKGKQMVGYDFHRQKPLDKYIVDFFCNELLLAIEIAGRSHFHKVRIVSDKSVWNRLELNSFDLGIMM